MARAILGGEVAQALGPRCSHPGQGGQVLPVPSPERGPDGLVAHVIGDGEVPQRLVPRALGELRVDIKSEAGALVDRRVRGGLLRRQGNNGEVEGDVVAGM